LRYPAKRARPRFCSEAQIVRLLEVARGVPPSRTHGLRPCTVYTLFGLLSVSGMRISEALHLKSADVDWDTGVLTVRLTKFGKSRLVPLHPSTVRALAEYARRRDGFLKRSGRPYSGYFLVANRGTAFSDNNARASFRELLLKAGLYTPNKAVHAFTICVIVSPSKRYAAGTKPVSRSSIGYPRSQPISGMSMWPRPIGI
jgi:integrase/recombinase XerD